MQLKYSKKHCAIYGYAVMDQTCQKWSVMFFSAGFLVQQRLAP